MFNGNPNLVYSLDLYLLVQPGSADFQSRSKRSLDRSFSHRLCRVSLPHVSAVLACVAAAIYYYFYKPARGNMRRGEDAFSPFFPPCVLESSSFALENKPAPATQARTVLIFRFWRAGLSVAAYCFGYL